MRMKALGVALMVAFAAFTTFYWITDAPRRGVFETETNDDQLAFGQQVFLFDDSYTVTVNVTPTGFEQSELTVFINTSINVSNQTGGEITVTATGAETSEATVPDKGSAPLKLDTEGETTFTASGVDGSLVVTANPPHLVPYGAGCARCHGVDGMGGVIPGDPDGTQAPNLHSLALANKWLQTGGAQGTNNYVSWVITLGGVVRSGNINSKMPAWGQQFGGSLTRQQIEALTLMIGSWAQETLDNPPPEDVPNTVEAGAQVYVDAGCSGCHGANLEGGIGPNLQTIGSSMVTDLPSPPVHLDQMQQDYDADPRAFLEKWIRDSAGNYNDGNSTGMPPHPVDALTDSQLQAVITFLLSHTE
jgi:mono/diheme cytochrome c family protein